MTAPQLVLTVPCYNEARRLRQDAFLGFVRSHPTVRLLFVDDGSLDGTADVHARLAAAAPGAVSAIRLERNQGKAEAVRQGVLHALSESPQFVGFWDADLATPLDVVDDFLAVAEKQRQVDVFLGSRVMLMGRDIRRKAWRHYLGRVFATAASLTLGIPVYDTQCGAKVFRVTGDVADVFSRPFLSPWIFDVEILARYLDLADDGGRPRRARIYEVALPTWHDVPGSKIRASDFARSLFELLAIGRNRPNR
jgi:dolichyl-phosphate beta-glucosyltransferase